MRIVRGVVVVCGLLGACANSPMTETGFLGDYSGLKETPELQVGGVPDGVRMELDPGYRPEAYDAVYVEPVLPPPDYDGEEDLAAEFREILVQTLGRSYRVVDAPRPGVLQIRAAITSVNPEKVWLNILTVVLLVPFDMGGISGEMEVLDGGDHHRIAAFTTCRDGTPFLLLECFTRYGHARHGMKKWARMLREVLRGEAP